jgi:hypothetical protein
VHPSHQTSSKRPRRLREIGQLYVTLDAARAYATSRHQLRRCGTALVEEARRDLTEFLLDATQRATCLWRRRTEELDVSARVSYERGLVLVVAVVLHDDLGL